MATAPPPTPSPESHDAGGASPWLEDLERGLARRRAASLLRVRRRLDAPQGPRPIIDGAARLAFCSNDYLGLASDPRVVAALRRGAREHGCGSGASHLVTGHARAHAALEEELAAFTGRPRALLFSSGYMANLSAVTTLLGRRDIALQDRLNHASLLDAAVLARARLLRYAHASPEDLERRLETTRGRRLIVTDGVFSMDGDSAPLPSLAALARRHGAWLMVDDAHGLGVLGPGGRGSAAAHGLGVDDVPVLVGTLGKALGTFGAFVAGPEALIEALIQSARPYVYTTALPPPVAEATREALRIAGEEEWRREHLRALVGHFRDGASGLPVALADSDTPIQPLVLGSAERALAVSAALERAGVLVPPIRPPTVPAGRARLRISFSAAHTRADVDRLLEALHGALAGG